MKLCLPRWAGSAGMPACLPAQGSVLCARPGPGGAQVLPSQDGRKAAVLVERARVEPHSKFTIRPSILLD